MTKLLGAVLTALLLVTGTLSGAGSAVAVTLGSEVIGVDAAGVEPTGAAEPEAGVDVDVDAGADRVVDTDVADSSVPSDEAPTAGESDVAAAESDAGAAEPAGAAEVAETTDSEGVGEFSSYLPDAGQAGAAQTAGQEAGWLAPSASAAAPTTIAQLKALRADIVKRTNAFRSATGAGTLKAEWRLDAVAQAWSEKQASAQNMSHNPSLKSQVPTGWQVLGENVAYGYKSAAAVMTGWRNSAGHYANIIKREYTHIGVGIAYAPNGRPYYTQVFAKYTGMVTPPEPVQSGTFVDMFVGAPFTTEIEWMATSGLSTGVAVTGGRAYKPKDSVSREAMAAFLYRLFTPSGAKAPAGYVKPKSSPFADVPTNHKFFAEIAWMEATGLSTGIAQRSGKPKYAPGAAVTREAMAAFLYRAEKGEGGQSPARARFADVKSGHQFFTAVTWMYDRGLSSGIRQKSGLPKYEPKTNVSREAMAAFLYRLKH